MFSLQSPCMGENCLEVLLNSRLLVWQRLPSCGPVSHQVCHSCVVTRWSCREDGGGVPASAGEVRRVRRAGCASCGQPVRRSEESGGLCPDDYVLVMFSQMLLIFAWLHLWSLLLPHRSLVLGGFYGEGGVTLGRLCGRRQGVLSHCLGLTGIRGVSRTGQHQSWGQAHVTGCGSKQLKQ